MLRHRSRRCFDGLDGLFVCLRVCVFACLRVCVCVCVFVVVSVWDFLHSLDINQS